MHLKRNESPGIWPIPRKGTKCLAVPNHYKMRAITALLALRDLLKVGKTAREIKNIIHEKKVKINGKVISDEKFPLMLFDTLSVGNKNYKLNIENKKFKLEETKENTKISKIIGRKILAGKKMQINLNDGRNFLAKEKMNIGDSVLVQDGKIVKVIPLKIGAEVIVIGGSHLGEEGKVEKIDKRTVTVTLKHGKLNLKDEILMAR